MIFVLELGDPCLPVLFIFGQALILFFELQFAFRFGPLEDGSGRWRRSRRRRFFVMRFRR